MTDTDYSAKYYIISESDIPKSSEIQFSFSNIEDSKKTRSKYRKKVIFLRKKLLKKLNEYGIFFEVTLFYGLFVR